MPDVEQECHGQLRTLVRSSASLVCPARVYKFLWQCENGGLRQAVRTTLLRVRRALTTPGRGSRGSGAVSPAPAAVLGLQPGEWVRVRSLDEIHARLDPCERDGGLAWMTMMEECCGREFKVFKRVERIVLESTGEIRRLKDTVLLESAICDGIYGCNKSCFFFWKEAWLERADRHA